MLKHIYKIFYDFILYIKKIFIYTPTTKKIMNVSDFQTLAFDETLHHLFIYVNENTAFIDDEDFKKAQWVILDFIQTREVKTATINVQKLMFSVSPELQTWTTENIIPKMFEAGITKIGYVMPEEFIEKLSIEQMAEEIGDESHKKRVDFGVEFFDNQDEALAWCVSSGSFSSMKV